MAGSGGTASGGATGSGGATSSGGAGAIGTPPDAGDGGADSRGDSGTGTLAGIHEYCEAWTKTVCGIELDCCRARGFQVSADWCPTPSVPSTLFQQPRCTGKLIPPANFDAAAANACVDIQPQLLASCGPARRDSAIHDAALASCGKIAPRPLPQPGEVCNSSAEPCAAPTGLVSVCYHQSGSGNVLYCSQAMTPQTEGQRCGDAVGCAEGLVCGPTGTCTPYLADGQACGLWPECRSGSCNARTCGSPPPVADSRCTNLQELARHGLYMNMGNGSNVTVTRSRLVWLGYHGPRGEFLHHAPKDGSGPVVHLTPTVVHTFPNVDLVADDDYVYDMDKGVVGRVALTNGARATLADVGFEGYLRVKDGNDLIVVTDNCSRLARVSVIDGSVALHPGNNFGQTAPTPFVAVDDQAVYCVAGPLIARFGRDGSFRVVTTAAVPPLGWTISLQAFGGRLYYWPGGDLVTDQGPLRSLDVNTGTISLLTPPSAPTGLTIADPGKGVLLWATAGGIQQYAPASGAATLIPTPVGLGYQLALDAAYFYWIKGDGVFRWPRP